MASRSLLSRRKFMTLTATVLSAVPILGAARATRAQAEGASGMRPLVIASGNGLRGVDKAYNLITGEGADPLDAVIAGVNIQELDPEDWSVGLGGLPNEHGVVQLDASCMHGPTRRAGAVGAIENIATPSLVAKAVMDYTDHVFLVGEGARQFAVQMGFKEQDLLTEKSRKAWLRWKTSLNPVDNWLEPGEGSVDHTTGTINMCAVDANGDLGSVTTTSGLSWKLPGRVGDSPLIGAGQYCDNAVGAAGSTGRGEANIKACGAFYAVEQMRQGFTPTEACRRALQRVVETTEDRLLDSNGRPLFGLSYYAITKDGRFGGANMYQVTPEQSERGRGHFAIANADGARLEKMDHLYALADRPAIMIQ